MSTPISEFKLHFRFLLLLATALIMGGCNMSVGTNPFASNAPTRMALENSGVVLSGPPGYCVDRNSVRESEGGVFAILGSCASVSGRANQPKPHIAGLISVSLGPALSLQNSVDSSLLASFVKSDRGNDVLAAERPTSHFRTLETKHDDGISFVFIEDKTINPNSGLENTYWRAVFFLGDRIATASVYSYSDKPLGKATGLATLNAFAQRIRSESFTSS